MKLDDVAETPQPKLTHTERLSDIGVRNPHIAFILSEFWAALAGATVYVLFHGGAFVVQIITKLIPLDQDAPARFLGAVFSWGGSLSASATFIVITLYQLLILVRRLRENTEL